MKYRILSPPIAMFPLHPHRTHKNHRARQQSLDVQVCVAAGTIDIIQNFPNYRETNGQQISYPMGLMVQIPDARTTIRTEATEKRFW
jgi:hypothetical protein